MLALQYMWKIPQLTERFQVASPTAKSASPGAPGSSTSNINGDMYIADGDYIKDIEVNDLRNRYTLTKGSTQKMVNTFVMFTDILRRPCREASSDICGFFITILLLLLWRKSEAYIWLI